MAPAGQPGARPDRDPPLTLVTIPAATMILGNDCRVVNDPNREERLALKALRESAATL